MTYIFRMLADVDLGKFKNQDHGSNIKAAGDKMLLK